MVEIRERHCSSDHAGLAQAYVSLGKAYVSLGRVEANSRTAASQQAEGAPTAEDGKPNLSREALEWYEKGLTAMEKSLTEYKIVYNENHPKVAHAHEGIAEVLFERGEYTQGEQHLDDAIRIRRSVQDSGQGYALFAQELDALITRKEQVSQLKKPKLEPAGKRKWRSVIDRLRLGQDDNDFGSAAQATPASERSAAAAAPRGLLARASTTLFPPSGSGGAKMSSALSPKRPGSFVHIVKLARAAQSADAVVAPPSLPTAASAPTICTASAASASASSDSAALEVVNEEPQNDGDAER